MPRDSGTITTGNAPLHGLFRFAIPDGTTVQTEFELWSSLTGEDAVKFKSSNWTGAWFNEATEVDFAVVSEALGRVDRYPSKHLGGVRWGGILMDFNMPPAGHWIEGMFNKPYIALDVGGEERRYRVASLTQPPAMFRREDEAGNVAYDVNPEAENLSNLRGGTDYYAQQAAFRIDAGRQDEVDWLFCLRRTAPRSGRPVWPMFSERRHVAPKRIDPVPGAPLLVGFDTSGIHPASVFLQFRDGRWCVTDELYGDRMGLDSFLRAGLVSLCRMSYPGSRVTVAWDPANAADSFTGIPPTVHLEQAGFVLARRTSNAVATRISGVAQMLNLDIGGLLVSPHCKILVEAMQGGDGPRGYHYERHRLRGSIDHVYSDRPEKNEASHIADALQYACLHIHMQREPDGAALRAAATVSARNRRRRRIMA
jgi:hypothetical protein